MSKMTPKEREILIALFESEIGKIPRTYVPESLTDADLKKQLRNLKATRTKAKGEARPKLKSAESRKSKYTTMAEKAGISGTKQEIADKLGDTPARRREILKGLDEIYRKGEKAYYTAGSRPNQTPFSWGQARVYSVLFGGASRRIDKAIVEKYNLPLLKG
jgi:hypothetical protein